MTDFIRLSACALTLCLGAALLAPQAHAAAECEANYRTAPSIKGRTLHVTSVGLQGMKLEAAAVALKKQARSQQWRLAIDGKPNRVSSSESAIFREVRVLLFEQQAVGGGAALHPLALVAEKTGSAILTMEIPPESPAPAIRETFCAFLNAAGLSGDPGAAGDHAETNFTYANIVLPILRDNGRPVQSQSDQALAAYRAVAETARQAGSLPMFEFKGLGAGQAVAEDHPLFRHPCFPDAAMTDDANRRVCVFRDRSVAGIDPLEGSNAYLYAGKLSRMDMRALNGHGQFARLEQALSARYGEPCRRQSRKWQNRLGGVFDNSVISWCFRTGTLTLTGMSEDRYLDDAADLMLLRYQDDVVAPAAVGPKIDF
jgi:hypothetical protein